MRTVRELIKELEKLDQDLPVVFRKGHGDGYFSDHELEGPANYYPGNAACFSIGVQIENDSQAGIS